MTVDDRIRRDLANMPELEPLPDTATLSEVIEAYNVIVDRHDRETQIEGPQTADVPPDENDAISEEEQVGLSIEELQDQVTNIQSIMESAPVETPSMLPHGRRMIEDVVLVSGTDTESNNLVAKLPSYDGLDDGEVVALSYEAVVIPSLDSVPQQLIFKIPAPSSSGDPSVALSHNLLSLTHPDTSTATVVHGDLIFGTSEPKWYRLPIGNTAEVLTVSAGEPTWSAPTASQSHNFLSPTHTDTTPASPPVRGSIVVASTNLKWQEYPIGANSTVLSSDGTDATWESANHPLLSLSHPDTSEGAVAYDDLIVGGTGPFWSALACPTSTSVLVYDLGEAEGSRIKWVALSTNVCP